MPPVNAERIARIRQLQREALARLPVNGLFILLFLRSYPPQPNDFHWSFYFHSASDEGMKYHVKGLSNGWMSDYGTTAGVFKSDLLCVLIQVAEIPESAHGTLDEIMRSDDEHLNSIPEMTCDTWIMRILEKLIQRGLARCNDLDALKQECLAFGNEYSEAAADNHQPRPVVKSKLCF